MNAQDLLRMPQLCLSTVIDTVKHGNGKSVNLRARPEGKIIAKIPNGTALQFADRHTTWGLVQYGELWGFVDARFLAESDAYTYTDTPPSEVLSHMKEHFGAYILEDYIAIDDTPDGDYGFALLSQSAERVLVGYRKNGNKMEYWLKSSNAVPQGEGWVYFQRHSADSIISWATPMPLIRTRLASMSSALTRIMKNIGLKAFPITGEMTAFSCMNTWIAA